MTLPLVHSQLTTEGSAFLQILMKQLIQDHWILNLSGERLLANRSSHWEDRMVTKTTEPSGFTSPVVNQMLLKFWM